MLTTSKLPRPLKFQHVAQVTWEGPFPVMLAARVGAFPADESSSYAINGSLTPYSAPDGPQTANLALYAQDIDLYLNGHVPHGKTHSAWLPDEWHDLKAELVVTTTGPESFPRKFRHVGVVTASFQFPWDMIRYDTCGIVATEANIESLMALYDPTNREPRDVLVCRWTHLKRNDFDAIDAGRWQSFRSQVRSATVEEVRAA